MAVTTYLTTQLMRPLRSAPVMACSNTFLEGSSAQGGTAVLFTMGGFPVLKLKKKRYMTIELSQNPDSKLRSIITMAAYVVRQYLLCDKT